MNIDVINAQQALERYSNILPSFQDTREFKNYSNKNYFKIAKFTCLSINSFYFTSKAGKSDG